MSRICTSSWSISRAVCVSRRALSGKSPGPPVRQLVGYLPTFGLAHIYRVFTDDEPDFIHHVVQRLITVAQPVQRRQRGKPRPPLPEPLRQLPRVKLVSPARIPGIDGFRRLKVKLRHGLLQQVLAQQPGMFQRFFLPAHFAVEGDFLTLHPAICARVYHLREQFGLHIHGEW